MLLLLLLLLLAVASAAGADAKPWMDRALPIPQRVDALLKTLSTEQKIAQTFAPYGGAPAVIHSHVATGLGAVDFLSVFHGPIEEVIANRNQLQADFVKASGIPLSFISEGLHGGAPGGAIFPMPVAQACSWNVSLVQSIARAIGTEARAIGVDTTFAPVVNMFTDPRFGRLQEGFSENPLLTAHMGAASVRGLQNSAPAQTYLDNVSVAALGKHFAAYGAATGGLNGGPATMGKRMLFDVFLRPWKAMAAAGLRATMPAHNTALEMPCHANGYLIGDVLRQQFGFDKGVALSDCNDVGVLVDFRVAANTSHAAALALKAGVDWDLQCGGDPTKWSYNQLNNSLAEGLITEADLDATVTRVLTHKFANGLFDAGPTDAAAAAKALDSAAHRQLAREAAEQSIVLLVNEKDALPLPASLAGVSVALLGPTASSKCNCSDATSSVMGSYSLAGAHVVTLDEALENAGATVTWEAGMKSGGGAAGTGGDAGKLAAAVAAARTADVALLVLGDIVAGGCGEWQDRDDLTLEGGQLELLQAVAAVAKKTVVVLVHGRPQTFGPGNAGLEGVDALFAAFRPGEEFGNAMVNLLTGAVSPSAKLSQSWPRSVGQVGGGASPWLQSVRGKWVSNARGEVDADGRRYDNYVSSAAGGSSPLFYFGFGLSYAKFSYNALHVAPPSGRAGDGGGGDGGVLWTAMVTVQNVGTVAGTEVVQVYVQDPAGLPFVPYWKRLVGFGRIALAAGETGSLQIHLTRDDVSLYSNDDEPVLTLYAGDYIISAGGSSNADVLSTTVHISAR